MSQFQLFDTVQLLEKIPLSGFTNAAVAADFAAAGTTGTIVEIFNDGEAYLVELFGDWVEAAPTGLASADSSSPQAFRETMGVEAVQPNQLRLINASKMATAKKLAD